MSITKLKNIQIDEFVYFYVDSFSVSASHQKTFNLSYNSIPYSEQVYVNHQLVYLHNYAIGEKTLNLFNDISDTLHIGDIVYVYYSTTDITEIVSVFYDEYGNSIVTENGDPIDFSFDIV